MFPWETTTATSFICMTIRKYSIQCKSVQLNKSESYNNNNHVISRKK